jgi:hypothetical protein
VQRFPGRFDTMHHRWCNAKCLALTGGASIGYRAVSGAGDTAAAGLGRDASTIA